MSSEALRTVRVWDLPTRLFHWALAALVAASFATQSLGGNWMQWHARAGFAVLALLGFRLLWGFAGGRYARFSSFLYGPRAVIGHLRGAAEAPRTLGHNPLGSLSVWALLAAVAVQAATGLFANDDIAFEGPLSHLASGAAVSLLTRVHKINESLILALVALHVAAVLFYLWRKRENLVRPMLTGDKQVEAEYPASRDDAALRVRGLVLLGLAAGAVWWLVDWAGRTGGG